MNGRRRPNGLRITGSRLNHPVLLGHVHLDIGNEWERHCNVLHVLVLDLLLDRGQPGNMAEAAIDRQADQLAVQRIEFGHHRGEGHEFRRADRSEIRRMAEKDDPLTLEISREVDSVTCRIGQCATLAQVSHPGWPGAPVPVVVLPHLRPGFRFSESRA
jgi:hypothetical protein